MCNEIKVGMIGGGIMAKAHSMALVAMPMFFWPAPFIPVRKTIADITLELARESAKRYGYSEYTSDWRDIIADPSIGAVHIVTPNDTHAEIAIAAARSGKHILCEKPIALTTGQAREMSEAASKAGVVHQLAFNYRRTPAVALAKKFIHDGSMGKILSYRGTYLWGGYDPSAPLEWRHQKAIAGRGTLGDIGTHAIDLARHLVGEIESVNGVLKTYVKERPLKGAKPGDPMGQVDVDDEVSFGIRFVDGATGSIEATNSAWGRSNYITFEIHGEIGSLYFNYNHRDELQVCYASDPVESRGFRTILTGPAHPYGKGLWHCAELGIGFSEIKAVDTWEFYSAIAEGRSANPNFQDGLKISMICDAVDRSSETGLWEKVGNT